MALFHSRSKNLYYRYLSNFQAIPGGITIPDGFILKDMVGYTFPSVENAFQAAKYALSERMDVIPNFSACTPREAKALGGKAGMKRVGTTLNTFVWNDISYKIMESLVGIRVRADETFRLMILKCRLTGTVLFHFERSGEKSFWGGYFKDEQWVGQNKLGHILNTVEL